MEPGKDRPRPSAMGEARSSSSGAASGFDDLFSRYERRVLAYAMRRAMNEADAHDAAVETFTIAWRKIDQVPADALPWLLAVARRVIANQRRSSQRRAWLVAKLGRHAPPPQVRVASAGEDGPALAALSRLPADDQELLRLVAWEELDHGAIASLFGISANAVAIRLHRAKRRFREQLLKDAGPGRTSTQAKGTSAGAMQERVE